jgi:hypothetical protein
MVTRLLASDLNPPHDTRHDTRLPVLTEVDGSMNPLEELEDAWELLEKTSGLLKDQLEYLPASGCFKYS